MGKNVLKTIATGDMFITRRIAKDGYEGFEEVRDCIMEHDVKFSNHLLFFCFRMGTIGRNLAGENSSP